MIVARAPKSGEGHDVMRLWRDLWELHASWGSYAESKDPDVYKELARRIDRDSLARSDSPILGQHIHLVAAEGETVLGQVEGWLDRHGSDVHTPSTCEVRSLIVGEEHRGRGVGTVLLRELERVAFRLASGQVFLVAEVLEKNPNYAFYVRLGYRPISYATRLDLARSVASAPRSFRARAGAPFDALPIALLDQSLTRRRIRSGDLRFDGERAIDASTVQAISIHLGATQRDPTEFVVCDSENVVRGAATLAVLPLEAPFLPCRRAVVGRFSFDGDVALDPAFFALVSNCARTARAQGAVNMEITDLPPPGGAMYQAAIRMNSIPWSCVVGKMATIS